MSKKNIAKLKRKCDKVWSEKIRSIGQCQRCKSEDFLNAHHLVTRRNSNLRWDLQNGLCLCCRCHKFSLDSFHNSPITVIDWFKEHQSVESHLRIVSQQDIKKITYEDMEQILKELTKESTK